MSLNDTLDRLVREREQREELANIKTMADGEKVVELAERIFFQRMLKDINPGMSGPKIDAMIDRSVMIAIKLYNKLYR